MDETNPQNMSFEEALKILYIPDFGERIFNSNSRGELFFINEYLLIAKTLKGKIADPKAWRKRFTRNVRYAKNNWDRPESIFQHPLKVWGLA